MTSLKCQGGGASDLTQLGRASLWWSGHSGEEWCFSPAGNLVKLAGTLRSPDEVRVDLQGCVI